MTGHTDNAIVVEAPMDLVWTMTNDVASWPDLFTEYDAAEIVREDDGVIEFRLTTRPDPDGRVWSWVSERRPDAATRTVEARRIETGPFEYMNLRWTYGSVADGIEMRWVQDFAMRPEAPFDDDAMVERLNRTTREQMAVIKNRIETVARTGRPLPRVRTSPAGPTADDRGPVTLVNAFEVKAEDQAELVEILNEATLSVMRHRPGFVSATIHASLDGRSVLNYAQWRSEHEFRDALRHPDAQPHFEACRRISVPEPRLYRVCSVEQA